MLNQTRIHALIVVFLLTICSYNAHARINSQKLTDTIQLNEPTIPVFRYTLRISPVRFIYREPHIGFEWCKWPKYSNEIRVGFVYSQPLMHRFYEEYLTSSTHEFQGPSLGYNFRVWNSTRRHYWLFSATTRYLWFTDKQIWMGGAGGSSFASNLRLSQKRNDLLVKVAYAPFSGINRRIALELGLGAMFSYIQSDLLGCTHCNPNSPDYEANLQRVREQLNPNEGLSVRPWVHINLNIAIFRK